MFDVVIIGAGVSGSSIARELSRYQADICVLEKEEDVCCGTSKANSAIVHGGYDALPGTLKAKLNVEGNRMMESLSVELDFPFVRNGSMVVCTEKENLPGLQELYDRGIKNGVEGLRILNREQAHEMEENLSDEVEGALYVPSGGIICPFEMNIAMAENAYCNGATFMFDTEVLEIQKNKDVRDNHFVVKTSQGVIEARCIVNAAGVCADVIHNMVSEEKISIVPRRGDYLLLDKSAGKYVEKTIFALPTPKGKGILVTPTVHGNLLVGPTAIDVEDKEGTNTTAEGLDEISQKAKKSVKNLPLRSVITSFAGLRAHSSKGDFIIEEVKDCERFFDCAGIESPGLSAAPAIGVMVADMVRKKLDLKEKENFISHRKGIMNPAKLSLEERSALIKEQPAYGNIICRCEMVSEGEIIDAVTRPLGARSLDGVKRRTRAGMGRCQSGFCSPRTMEIIAREKNMKIHEITKNGSSSVIVLGRNKENS